MRLWGPVLFKPLKSVIIPCPHSGDLCLGHLCIPCSESLGVLFTGGNDLSSVVKWKHVSYFLIAHGNSTVHRAECEAYFILSGIISEAQLLLSFPTRPSNKLHCSVTLVRIEVTNALTDRVLMPSVCTDFQELCRIMRMLVWANIPRVHLTER